MAIIVGIVVGAGIFKLPALVAANSASETTALLVWVLGGAISLVGALCYAELATTYPHPGGDYHFLTRAYGRRFSFFFGWARLAVMQTGSIALLAFVFGDYATQILRLGPYSSALWAALAVIVMTALNVIGIKHGRRTQNLLTTAQVVGVALVIVAGLALVTPATGAATAAPAPAGSALGLILVFVLLTYGGWNEAAYVSAELHEPRRNMVRALVWSLLLITALYLLINWAYLRGLGLAGMAGSEAVAADLMQRAVGVHGAWLVSLLVAVAALTSANATIFTGARTGYAFGRDFRPFAWLGRWHQVTGTPTNALVVQGCVALALIGLGVLTRKNFETMVEYTAPVFWFFFFLTGVSLFVLRRRDPDAPRPFRVPLYPLTPLLFCATTLYLLYASLAYTGTGALVGVAVLAAGGVILLATDGVTARPRPHELKGGR